MRRGRLLLLLDAERMKKYDYEMRETLSRVLSVCQGLQSTLKTALDINDNGTSNLTLSAGRERRPKRKNTFVKHAK